MPLHFTSQAGILHKCIKATIVPKEGTLLQNGLSFKSEQRSLKTRTLYTLLLRISY
jgi:hypothetical protein